MKKILFALLLSLVALPVFAKTAPKPIPMCPRVIVEFERCNPGDACHIVYTHPHMSPDAKIDLVNGDLYVFIRENGGTGTEWETIGVWLPFESKWASLFGVDLYDRVKIKADLCVASVGGR